MANIVLLSSGQSNMPHTVAYDWTPEGNLFIWDFNASNSPSSAIGIGFIPASCSQMGPSVVASNELAKRFPEHTIYVINISVGGLGLVNWGPNPPVYNFRQAISGNVQVALDSIGESKIDYFVWGGAESDANEQNQALVQLMETNLVDWLKTKSWFRTFTPFYVIGFTPYAQSQPGNADYLWRRYSNCLKSFVRNDPSCRRFVDINDFPLSLFDATGTIPYIHRTPEEYYKSGEKLGCTMINGLGSAELDPLNKSGTYAPSIASPANCSVDGGFGLWSREEDFITLDVRGSVTVFAAGTQVSFMVNVPIKAKNFPSYVSGHFNSTNKDSGIVVSVPQSQFVQVIFTPNVAGISAFCIGAKYKVNPSDGLPNPPSGTTY